MHKHAVDESQGAPYQPHMAAKTRDPADQQQLKEMGRRLAALIDARKRRDRESGERMPAEALAMRAGVPTSTLKTYRMGTREPGALALRALAVELGTSTDYLLGLTDDPAPVAEKKH